MAQLQTSIDAQFAAARIYNSTTSGFSIKLQHTLPGGSQLHQVEELGWIAVPPGSSRCPLVTQSSLYASSSSSSRQISYDEGTLGVTPYFIAALQDMSLSADPSWAESTVNADGASVYSATHGSVGNEAVGWMALFPMTATTAANGATELTADLTAANYASPTVVPVPAVCVSLLSSTDTFIRCGWWCECELVGVSMGGRCEYALVGVDVSCRHCGASVLANVCNQFHVQ